MCKVSFLSIKWRRHWSDPKGSTGEGNGNPLQCSCLENPVDRGAWWAAVYGVAQGRARLKRLSSSSSSSSKGSTNKVSWVFRAVGGGLAFEMRRGVPSAGPSMRSGAYGGFRGLTLAFCRTWSYKTWFQFPAFSFNSQVTWKHIS